MNRKKRPNLTQTRRSLPISLLRTRELIMEDIRPVLNRHIITEQQWRALRVIEEEKNADASTIAERACLLLPSLTRILRALESRGFIETYKDKKDGRRLLIRLTKEGQVFLYEVAAECLEIFSHLRSTVGNERWESLVELLTDIRDQINDSRKNST